MSGTPKCYRAASFSIPGPVDDLLPHVRFHTAAPASGQPRVGARRSHLTLGTPDTVKTVLREDLPATLPVGSRIRMHVSLATAENLCSSSHRETATRGSLVTAKDRRSSSGSVSVRGV